MHMQALSYIINVAQNGRHLFRTDPDTILDEDTAKAVYVDMCKRYPARQGFSLALTEWRCSGKQMHDRPGKPAPLPTGTASGPRKMRRLRKK